MAEGAPPPRTQLHAIADVIRWVLILAVWAVVAVWLWSIAWYWGLAWLVPGLVITMNVVGLAMVPLYGVLNGIAFRRGASRLLTDLEAARRTE